MATAQQQGKRQKPKHPKPKEKDMRTMSVAQFLAGVTMNGGVVVFDASKMRVLIDNAPRAKTSAEETAASLERMAVKLEEGFRPMAKLVELLERQVTADEQPTDEVDGMPPHKKKRGKSKTPSP